MQTIAQLSPIIIKTITQAYPDTLAIYLFGSVASGKTTPNSDLDVAVLLSNKIDNYKLWKTAQELAIIIKRDVDLIDLKNTTTILSFQIIHTGKRIFCADLDKVATFENIVFAEYINFQERLAGLLADVKKRGGIIYG